jgi:hypothetical protein
MIFFGSKGRVIAGEAVQGVQCPSCEQSQFESFGILNYFHLYWIPTFLTSKKVGIECMHCKRTLVDDEIPSHMAEQIKSGVFSTGNTLPMFSGLFIIGILVMGLMYMSKQDDALEASYIAQPLVNDFYIVDLTDIFVEADGEYPYGLMRVTDVASDGLEMQVANMMYNKPSGVQDDIRAGKVMADDYYTNESVFFEMAEIAQLQEDGSIYSIER